MSGSLAVPGGVASAGLRDLLGELGHLKRIRSAGRKGSVADRGFVAAWAALCAGEDAEIVMATNVAAALAAVRLGDLDAEKLYELGLDEDATAGVLRDAFDAVAPAIDASQADVFRMALGLRHRAGMAPPFVAALAQQPRAGATCPGKSRLILEPPENHAEHCWAVAVFGAILAPRYSADAATVFLAGLAHHLHNVSIPDSGFTGEVLLGAHLEPLCAAATARALDELPVKLQREVVAARRILADVGTPEGCAFHAADVVDRVMQLAQHLRVAEIDMRMLLNDWGLVHAGPVKSFHDRVLFEMGLP